MASKKFILCVFAFVLLGLAIADDYDGEEGEGDDGSSDDGQGGEGGGDYDSSPDSGDGGWVAPQEGTNDGYDNAASNLNLAHLLNRQKRSVITGDESKRVLRRVRRGGHGRVGHVYTYQKTDHKGNFKWGVKHSVGKEYAGK